ncbi:MAG TPA: M23 family metallopeptidase [Xanthomonadales bacterium]|nr:M23 family metallopeptidase [Xanthomonadales bacterium]
MLNRIFKTLLACVLLAAVAFSSGQWLFADNIYKFQDKDGNWHFTDRLPKDQQDFDTVFMERDPEPRIVLRQDGPQRNPVYTLQNKFWGPVEIEMSLSEGSNVLTEPELPLRIVLGPQEQEAVLGIGALNPRQAFSYKLHYRWAPGKPNPLPVSGLIMQPPFAAGESYPISQGFNGKTTHIGEDSRYAVDIVMPVGTPVLAARAGTVMDVEEDFNEGGIDKDSLMQRANRVLILHDDGTMAVYAHIDLASVNVRPGLHVRAGRQIARSGNTGFSTGPHLHFAVQQNIGMEVVSLPFKFARPDGNPEAPTEREFLEGTLPKR